MQSTTFLLRCQTKELAKKVVQSLINLRWEYNLYDKPVKGKKPAGHGYEWTAWMRGKPFLLALELRGEGYKLHMSGNNVLVTGEE